MGKACRPRCSLRLLEQGWLVAFDLKEILTALFHNDGCVGLLAMERVGRDRLAVEGGLIFE